MTKDANVRLPGELMDDLRRAAERTGLSVQQLAAQLLRRALMVGLDGSDRPIQVPVGLSPAAKQLEDAAGTDERMGWLFVYRSASGRALIVAGDITKVEPLLVTIEVRPAGRMRAIVIPRVALVGWKRLGQYTELDLFREVWPLQEWGAFLNPGLGISPEACRQNGVVLLPGE